MRVISIHCPNCGAQLDVSDNVSMVRCDYCNQQVTIDDEVKRFQLTNAEQAGYEFEKGRLRAIEEAEKSRKTIEINCIKCGMEFSSLESMKTAYCPNCGKAFDATLGSYLHTANEYEKQEYFWDAIDFYKKILEREPQNAVALAGISSVQYKLDNYVYMKVNVSNVLVTSDTLEFKKDYIVHYKGSGKEEKLYYDKMSDVSSGQTCIGFEYPGNLLPFIYVVDSPRTIVRFIKNAQKGIYPPFKRIAKARI